MTAISAAAILSAFWFGSALQAQKLEDRDPIGTITLNGARSAGQIRLRVPEAPSAGDIIGFATSTGRLRVALITPRGQTVTAANAAAAGFKWPKADIDFHLGSDDDPGRTTIITFAKPGAAGQYTLQVTAEPLKSDATATAWFTRSTSTIRTYRQFIDSVPWAQMPNPVPIAPSGVLRFELGPELGALFDVVVPDSAVNVTLALPGGQVLRQDQTGQDEVTWTAVSHGGQPNEPGHDLGIFALAVMPVKGRHHFISIPNAAKGTYEIRASRAGGSGGQLRAVLLPLKGIFGESLTPPPGQVRIRHALKQYEVFAGDQLDLNVGLLGDVGPASPEFRVRIEKTPDGTAVPGPIENLPVTFTRGADGDYHAAVVLAKAGFARIEVSAQGELGSGQAFTDRAIFPVRVHPVVARVLSLDAKAVDADGDRKLDRLDITMNLDVVVPGEFIASVYLTDDKQRKILGGASAELHSGHQSLTASIAGWRIWNELREGPYEVHVEQLFLTPRPESRSSVYVKVAGVERLSRRVIEPRDAWDHGPAYGEDQVDIHGILPAPSGRFRLAEVEWDATTPGGRCSWSGTLESPGATALGAGRGGEIPAGRRKFSFFFDGAAIAAAGARTWMFSAIAECDGITGRATLVAQTVNLDAGLYQAQNPDFLFSGPESLAVQGRGRWSARLYANNYKGTLGTRISLTEVPGALDTKLGRTIETGTSTNAELSVKVLPGAVPGRYFIGLAATSGSETVTRYIAVDISSLDIVQVPQ